MDKSFRILIIDDNQDDRKKLIHSLKTIQNAAYSFVEAKKSTTALKYINEQIDCVLLSYSLPDMDCLELLEKIRIRYPFLPLILMTGEGNEEIAAAAVNKCTDSYLNNAPMNPERLNQVIAKVMNQSCLEQKKQLMSALRNSEENERRLKFATETTGIGTWELNLENKSAYRSLSHDAIFGYSQLLPKWDYQMFLEHVIPEDRAEVDSLFQHAMETKSNWSFECRIQRADSKKRWIWAKGRHHFDSLGLTPMMSGIVMDITERKEVEQHFKDEQLRDKQILEELQESVAQFRLLANSLPQLVWMANETGWIYWYNNRWYEFTGTTPKETVSLRQGRVTA